MTDIAGLCIAIAMVMCTMIYNQTQRAFHLDCVAAIEKEAETRKALRNTVAEASHQLNEASLDSKILELRKDHGIDAIARILGCSQYRVRKCLDGIDGRVP